MIGGVEPGTFKHDPHRHEDFAQGFLPALGTARQLRIAELGRVLEPHTTIFTLVRINWHSNLIHTFKVGGQAVLGRQSLVSTPWLTERHGYDPTC